MKRGLLLVLSALLSSAASAAPCTGRIANPVTDVCWSCMFPVTVGVTVPLSPKGSAPDVKTDANPICACGSSIDLEAGLNFSFWEPVRTVEVVRHSGCCPTLGGVDLGRFGMRTPDHGRGGRDASGRPRGTAFWQVHWYQTPWLFVMEVLFDARCLEEAPWDLAYLSELDPLWDDTIASFLLSPDAALFTAGAAFGACAVDCIAATASTASNSLYWCSGCQGSVFPLSGWVANQVSPVQAWELLAHRFALKLAREGILWSAHGKRGQCGPYVQPLLAKDVWRVELMHPARSTDAAKGGCCRPLGRTTALAASGKTYPMGGEDGAVLLWRKRDCCLAKKPAGVTATTARTFSVAILREAERMREARLR